MPLLFVGYAALIGLLIDGGHGSEVNLTEAEQEEDRSEVLDWQ